VVGQRHQRRNLESCAAKARCGAARATAILSPSKSQGSPGLADPSQDPSPPQCALPVGPGLEIRLGVVALRLLVAVTVPRGCGRGDATSSLADYGCSSVWTVVVCTVVGGCARLKGE
jgi:hypothetical protein